VTIKLLIADDHAVLRAGLRMLLEAQSDMTVLGEAATGEETVAQVEALRPDIVLLDLSMPGSGGLDVIRRIKDAHQDAVVLVLTMHDDASYLRRALEAGAAGYVLKRAADTELVTAIRAVSRGGTYLHQEHLPFLLQDNPPEPEPASDEAYESLSPRERQVVRLVALGHTNQETADMLYLSVKTVESYRARLRAKLGLETRAALVRYALQHGLLVSGDDSSEAFDTSLWLDETPRSPSDDDP
jgi:two-component system response regulator NreC